LSCSSSSAAFSVQEGGVSLSVRLASLTHSPRAIITLTHPCLAFAVVKYLVSVRDSLTSAEMAKLRETPAFPQAGTSSRCTANQLYEPSEELKTSGLPLAFLDWPSKWRSNSDEARLLFDLELMKHPSIETIISLAANPKDSKLRSQAFSYLTTNFQKYYSVTCQCPHPFALNISRTDGHSLLDIRL
jgi:hypothetical protein